MLSSPRQTTSDANHFSCVGRAALVGLRSKLLVAESKTITSHRLVSLTRHSGSARFGVSIIVQEIIRGPLLAAQRSGGDLLVRSPSRVYAFDRLAILDARTSALHRGSWVACYEMPNRRRLTRAVPRLCGIADDPGGAKRKNITGHKRRTYFLTSFLPSTLLSSTCVG